MLATWKSSPKISDLDRGGSTQPHNSLLLTFFHFQSSIIDIDTDDAAEEEIATMVRFHKLAFGTAFVAVCTLIPSSPHPLLEMLVSCVIWRMPCINSLNFEINISYYLHVASPPAPHRSSPYPIPVFQQMPVYRTSYQ